jgi:hypothetical protein
MTTGDEEDDEEFETIAPLCVTPCILICSDTSTTRHSIDSCLPLALTPDPHIFVCSTATFKRGCYFCRQMLLRQKASVSALEIIFFCYSEHE